MRPNDLVWNYWVNDYLMGNDPPVFDILAWNADPTNVAGRLHGDFLEIMQKNLLVTKGDLKVLGTPVDLEKVTIDTYVTGATSDHLTPWRGCYQTTSCCQAAAGSCSATPGTSRASSILRETPRRTSSPARSRRATLTNGWHTQSSGPGPGGRTGQRGPPSARARKRRRPARLGSRRHRAAEPAPGTYVYG
jgi:polyhydroxyalkanoate synthase